MFFLERDGDGKIVAIRKAAASETSERELLTDLSLQEFFSDKTPDADSYERLLTHLDLEVIRVLDDLVDLLVKKNIIRLTDLPDEARKKLFRRKSVREKLKNCQVVVDDII